MEVITTAFLISAFFGGVIMFFAPCTFPIVPAFLASLVSKDVRNTQEHEVFIRTIFFTVGFSIIFVLLGMVSAVAGTFLRGYEDWFLDIGGVIIILFGLSLFDIPILKNSFQRIKIPQIEKGRIVRPLLLGIIFGIGWSPCAGPLLASILLLASQTGTALAGGVLLFVFSVGLAIPFIVTGAMYGKAYSFFNGFSKHHKKIAFISGIFLIIIGVSLIFRGSLLFTEVGFFFYDLFGIVPMCEYY